MYVALSCLLQTDDIRLTAMWSEQQLLCTYHSALPWTHKACSRCYTELLDYTASSTLSHFGTSLKHFFFFFVFVFVFKRKRKKRKETKKKYPKLTFCLKHSHSCLVLKSPPPLPPTPTTSNPHIPKEGTTASKQTHRPREGLNKTTALNKTIDTAWKGFIHITDYSSLTRWGRHTIGTRKTDHVVLQAEKTLSLWGHRLTVSSSFVGTLHSPRLCLS